jgi:hypothetical protein
MTDFVVECVNYDPDVRAAFLDFNQVCQTGADSQPVGA